MALRPGIVFLVQQIFVFFFTFLTNLFVIVATPEINPIKFKATLSALRILFALPLVYAEMSIDGISETAATLFLIYFLSHKFMKLCVKWVCEFQIIEIDHFMRYGKNR